MPTIRPKDPNCIPCREKQRQREAAQAARAAELRAQVLAAPQNIEGAPNYTRAPQTDAASEYAQHLARQGRPYSDGHRRIYDAAITLLSGPSLSTVDVLEVGMGLGYGFKRMLEAKLLATYQGVEPDADTFNYATDKYLAGSQSPEYGAPRVTLWNDTLADARPFLAPAPFVFCIEVVEHVPATEIAAFLRHLRELTTRNLFLSTPDATTSLHGVATTPEWKRALREAGFSVVTVARQWTTLYICE